MYGATTGWRVARTRATLAATKCCTSGWSADGRPGRSRTTGRSACRSNPRTRHVPTSASSMGSWRTRTSPKRSRSRKAADMHCTMMSDHDLPVVVNPFN